MNTLLHWIDIYDWAIYIVCTFGALIYLQWAISARREQRYSIFALEREEKGREWRQALALCLMFVAIAATTAYVNRWVLVEANGAGPFVGATLSREPTPSPSPVVGSAPPTPTATAEPTATSPATEAPPAPQPANCPNPGARISAPGVNQRVSGVVNVVGSANIENFQFYKVEVNSGGGFVVIGDIVRQPVQNGLLMSWNAGGSGSYTIRLTVVDATGNYPPPCDVPVIVP